MPRRDRLLDVAVLVAVCCTLVTTALVVRREYFSSGVERIAPRQVSAWREFARDGHRMGPVGAPVTIVVFEDFQCPYCALLNERLGVLRAKYPRQVAVVFRHFPLSIHPYAVAAARASECAAVQGRFEAFDNAVYGAQDLIGSVPWSYFARLSGIRDTSAFETCTSDVSSIPALARDTTAGMRLGVRATPTLLINRTELQGTPPLDTLEAYTAQALRSAP